MSRKQADADVTRAITVLATLAEYQAITKAAKAQRMSRSAWLRVAADEKLRAGRE